MIDNLTYSEAIKISEVFLAKKWAVSVTPYKIKTAIRYRIEWREVAL